MLQKGSYHIEGQCETGSSKDCSIKGEVNGTFGWASVLKPLMPYLAETGVISYQEFSDWDPREFKIRILDGTNVTTVKDNKITLKIFSSGSLLATKVANVEVVGSDVRLTSSSAQSVKNWLESYLDVADSLKYDFDTHTTGHQTTQIQVQNIHYDTLVSSTSWGYVDKFENDRDIP
ncbi:hypothetical protein [Alteromonas sp. 14N.309.X.WAT.G.H12]|uniref:hypothetical protein n=1 Tax=Alteromonas sp. 14N.309.X.WAT.G.H12 TaxID=3120824 RepID=UPI002FCE6DDD